MKIKDVSMECYRWPRPKPIRNGKYTYTHAGISVVKVETGGNEYTRYGFRDLIEHKAVAILNCDAQVLGGITEFMKVAALAAAYDLPVAPHGS